MKKLFLLAAVLSSALALTACGGGGGGEVVQVAASDTTLPVNATTVGAFINENFTFPAGVPELGTATATTVTFTPRTTATQPGDTTAPAGNPGVSIRDASGATATGFVEFGSCKFTITASSFPAGHRLAQGAVVTLNPCNVRLGTDGAPADGVARERAAVFILSNSVSTNTSVTIHINPGGVITINGQAAGTITLTPVTG